MGEIEFRSRLKGIQFERLNESELRKFSFPFDFEENWLFHSVTCFLRTLWSKAIYWIPFSLLPSPFSSRERFFCSSLEGNKKFFASRFDKKMQLNSELIWRRKLFLFTLKTFWWDFDTKFRTSFRDSCAFLLKVKFTCFNRIFYKSFFFSFHRFSTLSGKLFDSFS